MMYLLDSNILIYSKMDTGPEHEIISRWLTGTLANKESAVAVCETSILAFLRVSTNKKIFDPPLPLDEAASFIELLLKHPNVRISITLPSHYSELIDFMGKHDFVGNLAMDAHLAVLALHTGAVLVTRDGDFQRIPYLTTLNPLSV